MASLWWVPMSPRSSDYSRMIPRSNRKQADVRRVCQESGYLAKINYQTSYSVDNIMLPLRLFICEVLTLLQSGGRTTSSSLPRPADRQSAWRSGSGKRKPEAAQNRDT